MNVLTGIYVPTAGSVSRSQGQSHRRPHAVARSRWRGIARTFQNVQLFGEMTALENVLVGLHHSFRSNLLDVSLRHAALRARGARRRATAPPALLNFVGLAALADEEARNLPYGKQRLLEIGRALALDPRLLLLDEPAAGLTAPDIKELMAIIRKIRDARHHGHPDRAPHGRGDGPVRHASPCSTSARRSPRARRPRCRPIRRSSRPTSAARRSRRRRTAASTEDAHAIDHQSARRLRQGRGPARHLARGAAGARS